MVVNIPLITLNPFEVMDTPQEAASEAEFAAKDAAWSAVFDAVASGAASVAYWDCDSSKGVMRHALHKSLKCAEHLQESVFWLVDGDIIPMHDCQHGDTAHFLRNFLDSGVIVNFE